MTEICASAMVSLEAGEPRSDADRAALIGRLYARADAEWLAELLMDLEGDEGEPARLHLAATLQAALG